MWILSVVILEGLRSVGRKSERPPLLKCFCDRTFAGVLVCTAKDAWHAVILTLSAIVSDWIQASTRDKTKSVVFLQCSHIFYFAWVDIPSRFLECTRVPPSTSSVSLPSLSLTVTQSLKWLLALWISYVSSVLGPLVLLWSGWGVLRRRLVRNRGITFISLLGDPVDVWYRSKVCGLSCDTKNSGESDFWFWQTKTWKMALLVADDYSTAEIGGTESLSLFLTLVLGIF